VETDGPRLFQRVTRPEAVKPSGYAAIYYAVVVDERLVIGQNPASATGLGEAMVKLLR
jgi:putative intracellular protease/amidase